MRSPNAQSLMQQQQYVSSSVYSTSQSSKIQKTPTNISLNLSKASAYMQQEQQDLNNSIMDSSVINQSTITTSNNYSQKYHFDIYIQKVELSVPQPLFIYVQLLKGTNSVNTKKKIKVEQTNKIAIFNEKLSLVTQLIKNPSEQDFQPKLIQLRLLAFYNSKEKAIGICSVDLSQYVNSKETLKTQQKIQFSKCFDKSASITFEVRVKEQYNPIAEQITEETEHSGLADSENPDDKNIQVLDSARSSITQENMQPVTTQEVDSADDDLKNFEKLSSNSSLKGNSFFDNATELTKSQAYIKTCEDPKTQKHSSVLLNQSPDSKYPLNSARILQSSISLTKFPSSSGLPAQTSQSKTAIDSRNFQIKTPVINRTMQLSQQSLGNNSESGVSGSQTRKLEDKIKSMEFEIASLKRENQEYKQKVVALELKEERRKEFEDKCQEADAYKQKALLMQTELRRVEQEQQDFEMEKVLIIESYERKIHDMKHLITEQAAQMDKLRSQHSHQTLLTTIDTSTQPTDLDNEEFEQPQSPSNYKSLYDKLVQKHKKTKEENEMHEKRAEHLERQIMHSKEQIVQLVNELYSIEKQQINEARNY